MYYKSVNRGLYFTRAGTYATAFVLVLGLLAITSGVNALYLYLSFALSIIILSGVLSERNIKYIYVDEIDSLIVDSGKSFELIAKVRNASANYTLYGIEIDIAESKEKIMALKKNDFGIINGVIKRTPPIMTSDIVMKCNGMKRGNYKKIYLRQKTKFPFRLVEKYKYSERIVSLIVLPAIDQSLYQELEPEFKAKIYNRDQDKEFYCHNPYHSRVSKKKIDWKKSANRPVSDWVVKQYRSQANFEKFAVQFSVIDIIACESEEIYELLLSRVRTAIGFLTILKSKIGIFAGENLAAVGSENILLYLAALPEFNKRKEFNWAESNINFNDYDNPKRSHWKVLHVNNHQWF
ncbi:MAG: hypothetical protein R3B45_06275 [Bdellovibrionota bacterium]